MYTAARKGEMRRIARETVRDLRGGWLNDRSLSYALQRLSGIWHSRVVRVAIACGILYYPPDLEGRRSRLVP
jgi:hypothetical protein